MTALGQHLVRLGLLGQVGRFTAADAARHDRGTRVVLRTARGLEVGEVLAPADVAVPDAGDGLLLRRLTVEDELLLARLERKRDEAFSACLRLLADRGLDATLIDVEHLFDGQSLVFYFLGGISPALDALTAELAETYEGQVQFRQFTETLAAGCGPDCGTEAAGGCGTGGCSSCAVASACHKH